MYNKFAYALFIDPEIPLLKILFQKYKGKNMGEIMHKAIHQSTIFRNKHKFINRELV